MHSARNKDQKLVGRFLKIGLLHCCPIENVWEIWLIKIDFGRPNAEIGRKMASGRLISSTACTHSVSVEIYSDLF